MGQVPQLQTQSRDLYSLNYIRPRHSEIARRLVLGQTQSNICRELGMSTSRMSMIVNSPLFKLEVLKLERERDSNTVDVTKQIREAAPDCLDVLQRVMYTSKSERLKVDIAQDILDRAGYNAIQKTVGIQVSTDGMQDSELRDLLTKRLERVEEAAEVTEAQAVEAATVILQFDEVEEFQEPEIDESQKEKLIKLLNIGA